MSKGIGIVICLLGLVMSCEKKSRSDDIMAEMMDQSVKPQQDFYHYAIGQWQKKMRLTQVTEAVSSLTEYEIGYQQMLIRLIERSAFQLEAGESVTDRDLRNLATFYLDFLDEKQRDRLGLKPLRSTLDRIYGVKSLSEFAFIMGQFQGVVSGLPISVRFRGKSDDKPEVLLYPSIGIIPAYRKKGAVTKNKYVGKVLAPTRYATTQGVRDVLGIENSLEILSRSRNRGAVGPNFIHSIPLTKDFPFGRFFEGAGVQGRKLMVKDLERVNEIASFLSSMPVSQLKSWLIYRLIDHYAPLLNTSLAHAARSYRGQSYKLETRQDQQLRAAILMKRLFPEVLARVESHYFHSPKLEQSIQSVFSSIKKELLHQFSKTPWVSKPSRGRIADRVKTMTLQVGLPKTKRNTRFHFDKKNLVSSAMAYRQKSFDQSVRNIESPNRWQTRKRQFSYFKKWNQIYLPPRFLTLSFVYQTDDLAARYGSLGVWLARELVQGLMLDARLWSREERNHFRRKIKEVAQELKEITALKPESMAYSLAGEYLAEWFALRVSNTAMANQLQIIPPHLGFTANQRFYIAYGQSWRQKARSRYLMKHPRHRYRDRVHFVLSHDPLFRKTFSIHHGHKMFSAKKLVF